MTDTVSVEDVSTVEKTISIAVPPDVVNEKFTEFFNSIKKDAKLKGFRKGKVPLSVLKGFYKDQANAQVSQVLVSEHYQNALREHNINPIGEPIVDNENESAFAGSFAKDNSFEVKMSIEVLPEVDPVGYDELSFNLPEHDVEQLCQDRLLVYQEQFAERTQVTDAPAGAGDDIVLDFKGFVDGKLFEGGTTEGLSVSKLGNNTLIPGFEEQLIGLMPNEESRIKVTFPKEYNAEHLAGADAEFDVTIKSLVRKTNADVDKDLALMAGFESVGQLNDSVEAEVLASAERSDLQLVEAAASEQLVAKNQFEVPKTLVTMEANRLLGGREVGEEMLANVNTVATENVKKAILFEAIYEKEEDVKVAPEQLNTFLEESAARENKSKDELVSLLYNTDQMDAFVGVLRTKNVVEFLMELNAKESE